MVLKSTKKAKLIMIFGAPGAGKTAFSLLLAKLVEGNVIISSDLLRDYAVLNNKDNLLLNTTSHSAWKHFGGPNELNVINGFKAHNQEVWKYISPLVDSQLEKYKIVIIEGVHFDCEL